jgi:hypothetical protein
VTRTYQKAGWKFTLQGINLLYPEGLRKKGRPKLRWLDDVLKDLKTLNTTAWWKKVQQDGDSCKAVCYAGGQGSGRVAVPQEEGEDSDYTVGRAIWIWQQSVLMTWQQKDTNNRNLLYKLLYLNFKAVLPLTSPTTCNCPIASPADSTETGFRQLVCCWLHLCSCLRSGCSCLLITQSVVPACKHPVQLASHDWCMQLVSWNH